MQLNHMWMNVLLPARSVISVSDGDFYVVLSSGSCGAIVWQMDKVEVVPGTSVFRPSTFRARASAQRILSARKTKILCGVVPISAVACVFIRSCKHW